MSYKILIISCIFLQKAITVQYHYERENLINMAFEMCQHSIATSELREICIVNLVPNLQIGALLKKLHDDSISTHVINHQRGLNANFKKLGTKNFMFFVSKMRDILNLILTSAAQNMTLTSEMPWIPQRYDQDSREKLPNYCVKNPLLLDQSMHQSKKCDFEVNITVEELEDGSSLSDHVFSFTRRLQIHDIWNSKNNLIFMISKPTVPSDVRVFPVIDSPVMNNTDHGISKTYLSYHYNEDSLTFRAELYFVLSFTWRFFRGRKVVICISSCYNYDPFVEDLRMYTQGNENYFDFSYTNMHQKKIIIHVEPEKRDRSEKLLTWDIWWYLILNLLGEYEESSNCTFLQAQAKDDFVNEDCQKYGSETMISRGFLSMTEAEFAVSSQTFSVESCTICLVTPRAGLLPKYLTLAKCFTPFGWSLCFCTVATLFFVQYFFQRMELNTFGHIYSEREQTLYEQNSALLTVYSYFLTGTTARVLLGHKYTGKILFVIFSFSSLILGTLFQSKMVTFLSADVRYADINTPAELKESGMSIQSSDISSHSELFKEKPQYEELAERLTGSHFAYIDFIDEQFNNSEWYRLNFMGYGEYDNESSTEPPNSFALRSNAIAALEGDAFVMNIPYPFTLKENYIVTDSFMGGNTEYHRLEECLMTYPLSFHVQKNLFFFDSLNEKLAQLFETGYVQLWVENNIISRDNLFGLSTVSDNLDENAPKPFGINDLQPAFIGLTLGLLVSYFTFVIELMVDLSNG